jgi:hypothetical protein
MPVDERLYERFWDIMDLRRIGGVCMLEQSAIYASCTDGPATSQKTERKKRKRNGHSYRYEKGAKWFSQVPFLHLFEVACLLLL